MILTIFNICLQSVNMQSEQVVKWLNKFLMNAAKNGDLNKVKYFLSKGADIHVDYDYALRWSVVHGHLKVVKYLILQGANVQEVTDNTLKLATLHNHLKVVKYIKNQQEIYKVIKKNV